jgi:hypothetical protein
LDSGLFKMDSFVRMLTFFAFPGKLPGIHPDPTFPASKQSGGKSEQLACLSEITSL